MISNKTNIYMIGEILEDLSNTGISQLKDCLERLFNQLMITEREDYIETSSYEQTSTRKGYGNGFKNKKLLTKSGVHAT